MKNSKQSVLAWGSIVMLVLVVLWDMDLFNQVAGERLPEHDFHQDERNASGQETAMDRASTKSQLEKSDRQQTPGAHVQVDATREKRDEPEHFKLARQARWALQNRLQTHAITYMGACNSNEANSSGSEIMETARTTLEAEQEFPMKSHIVRWEMAFGLPEPGALIWAQWNGNSPATYAIHVQDATELRHSNSTQLSARDLKVPPLEVEASLLWPAAVSHLQHLKEKYEQRLGEANYRRIVVTAFAPTEPVQMSLASEGFKQKANAMGEFLNDRILAFSSSRFDCQSSGIHELSCSCRSR